MLVIGPPIVVAVFIFELGIVLEFAGVFILIISGILIPLASIAAQKIITGRSDFDFKNNFVVAAAVMMISLILSILSIIFILIE